MARARLLDNPNIPDDTKRHLRYGVFEHTDEHGRTKFVHDPGVREGRLSSLSVDRGHGHIRETVLRAEQTAQAVARNEPAPFPQPRDEAGRFAPKALAENS